MMTFMENIELSVQTSKAHMYYLYKKNFTKLLSCVYILLNFLLRF